MDLKAILESHVEWANSGGDKGVKADLSSADLSSANLRSADLSSANLRSANLSYADLRSADLRYADLRYADLRSADLSSANLRYADLRYADLRSANLSYANLSYANLSSANLRYADLSGVQGVLAATEYLARMFSATTDGVVCYKQFSLHRSAPSRWTIAPGSILTEVVSPDRTVECACGINVATAAWLHKNGEADKDVWKCLLRWPWLADVIVPYHTGGKIRCGKVELVTTISREELATLAATEQSKHAAVETGDQVA